MNLSASSAPLTDVQALAIDMKKNLRLPHTRLSSNAYGDETDNLFRHVLAVRAMQYKYVTEDTPNDSTAFDDEVDRMIALIQDNYFMIGGKIVTVDPKRGALLFISARTTDTAATELSGHVLDALVLTEGDMANKRFAAHVASQVVNITKNHVGKFSNGIDTLATSLGLVSPADRPARYQVEHYPIYIRDGLHADTGLYDKVTDTKHLFATYDIFVVTTGTPQWWDRIKSVTNEMIFDVFAEHSSSSESLIVVG